jgi:hypothetical protein
MNFRKILDEYCYTTELHAHTSPVSNCGKLTADFDAKLYARLGCNTLTITNHMDPDKYRRFPNPADLAEFYLSDYYKAKEAAKGTGLEIALGVEIRFLNTINDYLVYGISPEQVEEIATYIPKGIEEFYKNFKNDKNVILHAHPFRNSMEPTPLGYVDGIESLNMHPSPNSRIGIATRFARDNDLLVSAGSDFHDPDRMAMALMRTTSKMRDSFDIAEAIKSKDVVFDLSGHIVIPYLY